MVSKESYYVYRDFSQHSQMNTIVTMLGLMPKEWIKKLTLDQVDMGSVETSMLKT